MARPGRKSKPGHRTKSGRRVRAIPAYDKGSQWVQERRERFGEHYSTALGRAYASGLLGQGSEAKNRYDAGKRFARLYQRIIGGDSYRCPLNDAPRGNVLTLERESELEDQTWLFAAMDSMDVAGVRPYFDQLISTLHTDHGPPWVDRLLNGSRDPFDRVLLDAALKALDIIAPAHRDVGVRAANW